jgi:hypothetical protein
VCTNTQSAQPGGSSAASLLLRVRSDRYTASRPLSRGGSSCSRRTPGSASASSDALTSVSTRGGVRGASGTNATSVRGSQFMAARCGAWKRGAVGGLPIGLLQSP